MAHEVDHDPQVQHQPQVSGRKRPVGGRRGNEKHRQREGELGPGSQLMIETEAFARYWGTDTRYLSAGRYLIVAPTLAGGKAYALLAEFFLDVLRSFDIDVWDRNIIYERMNELARSSSKGLTFTPHFLGSRTHGEEKRATIEGINAENFRATHITRALLEGMITEVKEPYDRLPSSLKQQRGLVVSGNAMLHNAALRSVAEEAFALPLRHDDESVRQYVERLDRATDDVRRHAQRGE